MKKIILLLANILLLITIVQATDYCYCSSGSVYTNDCSATESPSCKCKITTTLYYTDYKTGDCDDCRKVCIGSDKITGGAVASITGNAICSGETITICESCVNCPTEYSGSSSGCRSTTDSCTCTRSWSTPSVTYTAGTCYTCLNLGSCDGTDADKCADGTWTCSVNGQTCTDDSISKIENCNNAVDDDCDGTTDGKDTDCAVEITKTTVSNDEPIENTKIDVTCETTPSELNCIEVKIGDTPCVWKEEDLYDSENNQIQRESFWEDGKAIFTDCYVGERGTRTVTCSVNTEKCLQTGNDQTTTITIQSTPCSNHDTSETCNADPDTLCEWCEKCNEKRYNGLSESLCVPIGECSYTCDKNECEAECSVDWTGCQTVCDDNDKCYSGTYRDYTNPGCSDDCKCQTCDTYTEIITDLDKDGYDTNCDGDCDDGKNAVHPNAPEICGDGVDNDCEGEDEKRNCCEISNSIDVDLNGQGITNPTDYYLKDKTVDYYWNNDACLSKDYYDTCQGNELTEYYATTNTYASETHECPVTCEGQTKEEINYEIITSITYSGGCLQEENDIAGKCTEQTIKETCNEETLIEPYCEGNQLKTINKNCNDYDGYYNLNNERRYVDFTCQQGVCKPETNIINLELSQGELKLTLKNMGSIPLQGILELSVNNFCPANSDIILLEALNLGIHETYTKTYDFIENCRPVSYTFTCNNKPNYVCAFWPGEGCGWFTHTAYSTCDTCCGQTILSTQISEQECSQSKTCESSTITAIIKKIDGTELFEEKITEKANWCCI